MLHQVIRKVDLYTGIIADCARGIGVIAACKLALRIGCQRIIPPAVLIVSVLVGRANAGHQLIRFQLQFGRINALGQRINRGLISLQRDSGIGLLDGGFCFHAQCAYFSIRLIGNL